MPTENTNAQLSGDVVKDLAAMKWTHLNLVDLHAKGVHWFDPDFFAYVGSCIDLHCILTCWADPPVALPTYFPDDISETITKWLDETTIV